MVNFVQMTALKRWIRSEAFHRLWRFHILYDNSWNRNCRNFIFLWRAQFQKLLSENNLTTTDTWIKEWHSIVQNERVTHNVHKVNGARSSSTNYTIKRSNDVTVCVRIAFNRNFETCTVGKCHRHPCQSLIKYILNRNN